MFNHNRPAGREAPYRFVTHHYQYRSMEQAVLRESTRKGLSVGAMNFHFDRMKLDNVLVDPWFLNCRDADPWSNAESIQWKAIYDAHAILRYHPVNPVDIVGAYTVVVTATSKDGPIYSHDGLVITPKTLNGKEYAGGVIVATSGGDVWIDGESFGENRTGIKDRTVNRTGIKDRTGIKLKDPTYEHASVRFYNFAFTALQAKRACSYLRGENP